MAKLEDLLKQIPDAKLRAEIAREVVALEARLQSADAARERGRLVAAVLALSAAEGMSTISDR